MIIKGSMNYDYNGRKIKRKRSKTRSSSRLRTSPFQGGNTGSKPVRVTKKGAVAQQGERRTCTAKVADSMSVSSTSSGKGTLPDNSWKVEISKQYTIAPAYNKGAYQVIPRKEVKDIGK